MAPPQKYPINGLNYTEPSGYYFAQVFWIELVGRRQLVFKTNPGRLKPLQQQIETAIRFDRMIEQAVDRFRQRVILFTGQRIRRKAHLPGLFFAFLRLLGIDDPRRVARNGRRLRREHP